MGPKVLNNILFLKKLNKIEQSKAYSSNPDHLDLLKDVEHVLYICVWFYSNTFLEHF